MSDPEVVSELLAEPEGRSRDDYARSALRIGVLAIRRAAGEIDASQIRGEGDRLLDRLSQTLAEHQRVVGTQLTGTLREYFDPASGRFQERVERLVKRDGELEQVLRRQIGTDGSELARTLSDFVGEDSPLLKRLDPEDASGFIGTLIRSVEKAVDEQREAVLGEFSLDNKQGALFRLVSELTEHHGKVGEALKERIDEVMGEFSLDDDSSALSRLVRRVESAQQKISSEFSLDEDGSALARMRRDLISVLDVHKRESDRFHQEVREALAALAARRAESERSTRHGDQFEENLCSMLETEGQKVGDVVTRCGTSTGLIKNCKVGDLTIDLGHDSAAPGARIVAEAKEKGGYTLAKALAEIAIARKNRGADVGLFVFSKRTAPEGLRALQRYGTDVVIVWDADDPASDVILVGAFLVTRALCVRSRETSEGLAADFEGLDRAILEVENQSKGLDEISTLTGTIQNNAEKIIKRASIMRAALKREIENLSDKVEALRDCWGSGSPE